MNDDRCERRYQDGDANQGIDISEPPRNLVFRSVKQRHGERREQDGVAQPRYPRCREISTYALHVAGEKTDALLSFANHTLGSTLTGVGTFLGTLTWGGTWLMAW